MTEQTVTRIKKRRILAWVPEELAERLDVARDGRPMGVYVARLLGQALDGEKRLAELNERANAAATRERSSFRRLINRMLEEPRNVGETAGDGLRELLRRLEEGA